MRSALLLTAAFLALATAAEAKKAPPPAAPGAVPAPTAADWRAVDPQNVLVIDTNQGRVIVEMAPEMAPNHVARIRELTQQHFYDGLTFFRVIEDFMDQTGDPQNSGEGGSKLPNLEPEFFFKRNASTPFVQVASANGLDSGFIGAVPVRSQTSALMALTASGDVQAWGVFCKGVAAMARAQAPNTANSQFFLMRGFSQQLERSYTPWGVVLSGEDVVRKIKTGEPVAAPQDRMTQVRLLADIPEAERPKIKVIDTKSAYFQQVIAAAKRTAGNEFSVCDVDVPVQVK